MESEGRWGVFFFFLVQDCCYLCHQSETAEYRTLFILLHLLSCPFIYSCTQPLSCMKCQKFFSKFPSPTPNKIQTKESCSRALCSCSWTQSLAIFPYKVGMSRFSPLYYFRSLLCVGLHGSLLMVSLWPFLKSISEWEHVHSSHRIFGLFAFTRMHY